MLFGLADSQLPLQIGLHANDFGEQTSHGARIEVCVNYEGSIANNMWPVSFGIADHNQPADENGAEATRFSPLRIQRIKSWRFLRQMPEHAA